MNYEPAIIAAAGRYGIDPAIALAVARRESGIQQYGKDGAVIVGGVGEIGIFQVKPSTAPGVNLRDPMANIDFGVRYLASLLRKFGSWPLAIAAYNWGEGRVRDLIAGTRTMPAMVGAYVDAVLGSGQAQQAAAGRGQSRPAGASTPSGLSPGVIALGVLGMAAVLILVTR